MICRIQGEDGSFFVDQWYFTQKFGGMLKKIQTEVNITYINAYLTRFYIRSINEKVLDSCEKWWLKIIIKSLRFEKIKNCNIDFW